METIEWNDNGTGFVTKSYGPSMGTSQYSCYKKDVGIQREIQQFVCQMANTPEWNKDDVLETMQVAKYGHSCFNLIRPIISYSERQILINSIKSISRQYLLDHLKGKKLNDCMMTDLEFLALLSTKRNWKKGCAICIEEKNMGTTCGCGHTEIVVFRPCGHAICVDPCFKNLMNFKSGYSFECPECRTKIINIFRTEDVNANKNNDLIFRMTQRVLSSDQSKT